MLGIDGEREPKDLFRESGSAWNKPQIQDSAVRFVEMDGQAEAFDLECSGADQPTKEGFFNVLAAKSEQLTLNPNIASLLATFSCGVYEHSHHDLFQKAQEYGVPQCGPFLCLLAIVTQFCKDIPEDWDRERYATRGENDARAKKSNQSHLFSAVKSKISRKLKPKTPNQAIKDPGRWLETPREITELQEKAEVISCFMAFLFLQVVQTADVSLRVLDYLQTNGPLLKTLSGADPEPPKSPNTKAPVTPSASPGTQSTDSAAPSKSLATQSTSPGAQSTNPTVLSLSSITKIYSHNK